MPPSRFTVPRCSRSTLLAALTDQSSLCLRGKNGGRHYGEDGAGGRESEDFAPPIAGFNSGA